MIITFLRLRDYDRLAINNFNELIYRPGMDIQIILGSNGSGKSSTLKELTPLPAHLTKDYGPNGFKEIHITHHDIEYKLISDASTNKHNFIKSGNEMNHGGTRKAQLELVKECFNITPMIHDVMTGTVKFTSMSVSERKKWLTDIADVDYTYSITVFNKLKSRHRDIVGAMKLLSNKISNMEKSSMTTDELDKNKQEHSIIIKIIDMLLESKSDIEIGDVPDNDEIIKILDLLEKLIELYPCNITVEEHESKKTISETKINSLTSRVDELTKDLSLVAVREDIDATSADKVSKELSKLLDKKHKLIKRIYLDVNEDTLKNLHYDMYSSYTSITGELNLLTGKEDINITHEHTSSLKSKETILKNKYNDLKSRLIKLNQQLSILEDNKNKDKITCSSCGHSWLDGYDENNYKLVKSNISKVTTDIETLDKDIKSIESKISIISDKLTIVNNIVDSLNSNKYMTMIYDYITNTKKLSIGNNVNEILTLLYTINNDIEKWMEVYDINDLIKDKELELQQIHDNTKLLSDVKVNSRLILEDKLNTTYKDIDAVKVQLEKDSKILSRLKMRDSLLIKLKSSLDSVEKNIEKEVLIVKNEYINDAIRTLRLEAYNIETRIKDSEFNVASISNASKELNELQSRKKVLELMIKELSPNEGLIARSILSFLVGMTNSMNKIINDLWSYELLVLPCGIDSGNDLNYRFPVVLNGNKPISDVSMTSSSMQEIINLSFKIISAIKLGISDHPLILDEYSSSFDTTHRLKAYDNIEVISRNFNQVFIVSHYNEVYGRFTNADVSIISPDNIFLEDIKEYNTRMEFK